MGQAKRRGTPEDRQAQARAAARLQEQQTAAEREARRRERRRQEVECNQLRPKFHALPPVLKQMVIDECKARGVRPLWLDPPRGQKQTKPSTPLGMYGLSILAAAIYSAI